MGNKLQVTSAGTEISYGTPSSARKSPNLPAKGVMAGAGHSVHLHRVEGRLGSQVGVRHLLLLKLLKRLKGRGIQHNPNPNPSDLLRNLLTFNISVEEKGLH